ncbi:MAG: cytochrome c3 family protein [Phycisphaerales bacterium]
MTRTRALILLVVAGVAVIARVAGAQPDLVDPGRRPTGKVTSCTTAGCHARQLDHKVLHGPTAVSACDACHEYKDASAHTFSMKRQGIELCAFCHIDKTVTEGPVVHEPFAKGQCAGCHDPHGADTRALLKKPVVSQLCVDCHKDTMKGTHAHEPAAKDCTQCHRPHVADHAKLLVKPGKELCMTCHEEVGRAIASMKHPHKPAQGDCLDCHSPHATDNERILKKAPQELCTSCHAEVGRTIAGATVPHGAVTDAKSCINCHSGHASDHPKQLVKDPVAACLACHNKPIVVDGKRTVPAAGEVGVEEFHKHGPIKMGECGACHDVHGGKHQDLLVEQYDKTFYQKYTENAYVLCFRCHQRSMLTATEAGEETGFRNGTRNLHAIHVKEQGRSCVACHNVHASRNETMVADSVSFGQWNLPLNFVKTPTGGSCAPGCHKPESYERVKK